MILTPHLLVGAALGQNIHNFWMVFILAIIFHFLTDMIPHWDYVTDLSGEVKNKFLTFILKAGVDFSVGAFFIFYFFWDSPFFYYMIIGAFASVLPDIAVLSRYLIKIFLDSDFSLLKKYDAFHEKFHVIDRFKNAWQGMAIEGGFVIFLVYLLLK